MRLPKTSDNIFQATGIVICLELGADMHMAQLMPLPLTVSCFSKIQLGLPFWYWLTRVVPEKGPLNRCVCVCAAEMCLPKISGSISQMTDNF